MEDKSLKHLLMCNVVGNQERTNNNEVLLCSILPCSAWSAGVC